MVSDSPAHINVTPKFNLCGTQVEKSSLRGIQIFLALLTMIPDTCRRMHPDAEQSRKVNI